MTTAADRLDLLEDLADWGEATTRQLVEGAASSDVDRIKHDLRWLASRGYVAHRLVGTGRTITRLSMWSVTEAGRARLAEEGR